MYPECMWICRRIKNTYLFSKKNKLELQKCLGLIPHLLLRPSLKVQCAKFAASELSSHYYMMNDT